MPGIKITLNTTFSDTTLPKIYPDAIMADGALLLVDFTNSAGWDFGASIPVNGNLVGNVAWPQAAAIIGSGDRTTLSPAIANVNMDATGKIEFSGKKGLHVITSQTSGTAKGLTLNLPIPITAYIINNAATHLFYFSLWYRNTRVGLETNEAHMSVASSTSALVAIMANTGNSGITTGGGSYLSNGANALGNGHRVIGTSGIVGAPSAASQNYISFGNKGWASAFTANKASSWILYKAYIEDLTVSGRSYATVLAKDQALYTAAFGTGGQFAGDTFTDPSTLP